MPILLIVAWFLAMRYLGGYWPNLHKEIGNGCRRLSDEIRSVFPVFSAQTTENREAEFIPDRLPGRFPFWVALLAIIAISGLAWWITG
jgi:hypothetical protein